MDTNRPGSGISTLRHRRFLKAKVPKRTWTPPIVRPWHIGSVVLVAVATLAGFWVWDLTRPPVTYGTLVATVILPGNGRCSVGGTFDGQNYITIRSGCFSDTLQIFRPPSGDGEAALVTSKSIRDSVSGMPVNVSAVAWDSRRRMMWGAMANAVYLIDPGQGTRALATFQFIPGVMGSYLIDGLAYDVSDDTLYYVPDSNPNVYHFSLGGDGRPLGTLMNIITPKDANGQSASDISGVVVGSDNSLYIGRNPEGISKIVRVDKVTGDFISDFATTFERVEDLTCDPVTYSVQGLETVLAKDAFNSLYEAFEVEPGTCQLPARDSENQ